MVRTALTMAFVLAGLTLPAAAQQRAAAPMMPQSEKPVQVGTSVICDTQGQMQRFVQAFDGDIAAATRRINREENKSDACIVATMAYMVGDGFGTERNKTGAFNIVRVLVLGLGTARGMQPVQPATFFSVVKIDEQDA